MSARPTTIVHVSDFHFGAPLEPAAAAALPAAVAAFRPDLVVFTGDFTQRAKPGQFAAAAELWNRLPAPRVAAIGNHDVPTYRLHERLLAPYRNYERHVGPARDAFAVAGGCAAALLNTNSPWLRMVHGRMRGRQARFCAERFAETPAGMLRLVAAHHPFLPPPERPHWPAVPGAAGRLAGFLDSRVELVFGGHWHCSYAVPFERGGRRLWVLQAGTATSTRGRGPEKGRQTFNVVTAHPDRFDWVVAEFRPEAGAFVPAAPRPLPRA